MKSHFLWLIVLFASIAFATRYQVIQLQRKPNLLRVVDEKFPFLGFDDPKVIVVGEFNASILKIGWNALKIETNGKYTDEEQAYAAGYFEGSVTYEQIYNHYHNLYNMIGNLSIQAEEYMDANMKYLEEMIPKNNRTDDFWYHVGLMWIQWNGLFDGVSKQLPVSKAFSKRQLFTLSSLGDMFDLLQYYHTGARKDWRKMSKDEFEMWTAQHSHCSALFKITEDFKEIFFGHTSWFDYNAAQHIFKHYTLNYNAPSTASKTITLSGYPGILSSFDDFYLTDGGLATIETSLPLYNSTMYKGNIRPDTVLYWMRVMVANRMASNGPDWVKLFAKYNSGTYNNQWTVLDLKLFKPGQDLQPNTLWIAEQYPGVVGTRDVTDILQYGYYPSYNVPSIPELYWASGCGEATRIHGPAMTDYQLCVRARIFRRDQTGVKDMESFQRLMQYNDFEVDPISNGNPLYAIASRGDLSPNPRCFGAYDVKASSYSLWKSGLTTLAFAGPTPQQPRFQFNMTLAKCAQHEGLPTSFDFGWSRMQP